MNYTEVFSELAFNIPQNISTQLYEKIRSMIVSEKLPPGYTFPNESALCAQLGIGRTTLREAYKALEANGYITRSKSGTRVNDPERIAAALPFSLTLGESDFNDMIEFRAIFESQTAALAAQRTTDENIVCMRKHLYKMQKYSDDLQKLTYHDMQFHMELTNASANQLFRKIMLMSYDVYLLSVYKAFQIDTTQNITQALISHANILSAVEQHDAALARQAMYEHIRNIQQRSSIWGSCNKESSGERAEFTPMLRCKVSK